MAVTLTITLTDAQGARAITAICARCGYRPTLPDGSPNPQTQAQFAKQQLIDWVRSQVTIYEAEQSVINNDINPT
jgi:hypothetical protein